MATKRNLPDWPAFYEQMPVEAMPWFNPKLDPDLARALAARGLSAGRALDLGAGPGTQAIELARLGFEATGTDIAPGAVLAAQRLAEGTNARFVVDDVLATKLAGPFDVVFDRGCFHVLSPEDHSTYLRSLLALLAPGGHFFLKCFSALEPGEGGPMRFTADELRAIFGGALEMESIVETVYYANVGGRSTLDHEPRSLFAVMRRR